ncbi:AbrB/MazE/SpoVT family DNA-binding domain-containing protein [Candidatus Woesearchaeota archaeon]|nr:AbrB/MazE/SpoVT family DNA-binding domain-containing protein [Candidatus Woesearchaeota archaeon]
MSEIITMSSKGQVVIPKDIREEMGFEKGTSFVAFGKDGTLVLKRVDIPSAKETFERIHQWGKQFAKRKGIRQKDVGRIIHKRR